MYNFWLHFGLNFGVIVGAKFATILLFGRPGGQNRLTKERRKKVAKKLVKKGGTRELPPRPGGIGEGRKSSMRLLIRLTGLTKARSNTAGARRGRAVFNRLAQSAGPG